MKLLTSAYQQLLFLALMVLFGTQTSFAGNPLRGDSAQKAKPANLAEKNKENSKLAKANILN